MPNEMTEKRVRYTVCFILKQIKELIEKGFLSKDIITYEITEKGEFELGDFQPSLSEINAVMEHMVENGMIDPKALYFIKEKHLIN